MLVIVHKSHKRNLDLQKKSTINEELKNKTYWDMDGASSVAFLFTFD
jgi:hypothetical protein